jgi:hypothetical protein
MLVNDPHTMSPRCTLVDVFNTVLMTIRVDEDVCRRREKKVDPFPNDQHFMLCSSNESNVHFTVASRLFCVYLLLMLCELPLVTGVFTIEFHLPGWLVHSRLGRTPRSLGGGLPKPAPQVEWSCSVSSV